MKLSILTATYNRANFLEKLYNSILKNLDNSSQEIIKEFKNKSNFVIKSFKQHNQGKMHAINNLMKYANGECIIECDSDDVFMENSLKIIKNKMNILLENENLYALVFF